MFVLAADLFSLLILNRTRLINDLNEVIALLQHSSKETIKPKYTGTIYF